jgi:dTDP-L-rhamnose 4-epimerase
MRVLVTGGQGFIGSHIVDALVADGHDVRVLDAQLARSHASAPGWHRPEVEYLHADVTDLDAVATAVAGIDAVSHQAVMVGLGVDFGDAPDYVRNNDLGTATLLRGLHDRNFQGPIALASSMVVYGEGQYRCPTHGAVPAPPRRAEALAAGRYEPECVDCGAGLDAVPVFETAPPDPRNVYAATKLHQEYLGRAFAREHDGVVVTALRYHNVYGPRMPRDTPYAGVASIWRSALARGDAPQVFEDGGQRRDFIHVADVARANVLALTAECPYDGPLNIATGSPRSILEMARALVRASAAPALEPAVTGAWRLGDVRHVFASPDRAAEAIGFRARVDFEAGMREFARAPQRAAAAEVLTVPGTSTLASSTT